MAGGALGIDAVIVMPTTTPAIKVDAVRALGGRAVLHGDTFDDAYAHAREIGAAEGRVFIHPYDDPDVIAARGRSPRRSCGRAASRSTRSSCRSAAAV